MVIVTLIFWRINGYFHAIVVQLNSYNRACLQSQNIYCLNFPPISPSYHLSSIHLPHSGQGTVWRRGQKYYDSQKTKCAGVTGSTEHNMVLFSLMSPQGLWWQDRPETQVGCGGRELTSPPPKLRSCWESWLLREGEEVVFIDVCPGGLTMLQWMAPHPCTHGQHKLDLVGHFFLRTRN